jgi:hypothetical protein
MAGLEGTIKVPVFGTVKKKTAAITAGASVVGVLGVWYIRQRRASQAAAAGSSASAAGTSAAAGQVTDPAGNVCTSDEIDPETGYCSGSAQDLAAQQAASGDLAADDATTGTTGISPISTTTAFADNAAWAQAVETYLGSDGADSIAAAVAKYTQGQQITTAQQTIVEEGIAAEGYPPVAGNNGYPPAMNVVGTNTGTGGGGTGGSPPAGTVKVPNVTGMRTIDQALPALKAAGLVGKVTGGFKQNATNYVASQTPGAGKTVDKGSTVDLGSTQTKPKK